MIVRLTCLAALVFAPTLAHAAPCGDLTKLTLANTTVIAATPLPAGAFTPADTPAKPLTVPAFCRVQVHATPVPDSDIGMEVWLPQETAWNGKLLGFGNGGYSSVLDYPAMVDGLRAGYAVVATDQGHYGDDLRFVVGHPGKVEDWADRAIHVMTNKAKMIVRDALGRFPEHAYFNGCSTGGFQGMAETQRHPQDYDGVIAGAPGYPRLNLSASFLAAWAVNHDASGAEILPVSKLPMLNKAAVTACGTNGVIEDPRQCRFNPGTLQCKETDAADCLTPAQVGVVRAIYAGPKNPRTHEPVFPGWDPGSEAPGGNPRLGWTAYIVGQPEPVRLELWKYWLFGNPDFDRRSFDLGRDLTRANELLPVMNAVSPDLSAFRAHGGKLLMYHGWADNVSSARGTIDYYDSVEREIGNHVATQEFYRVFLVPGMGHCKGGPGTDHFDPVTALAAWVERDHAPDRIVATHETAGTVDRAARSAHIRRKLATLEQETETMRQVTTAPRENKDRPPMALGFAPCKGSGRHPAHRAEVEFGKLCRTDRLLRSLSGRNRTGGFGEQSFENRTCLPVSRRAGPSLIASLRCLSLRAT